MINFLGKYGFIKKKMSINDLNDHFFNSFSIDYPEFTQWFSTKSAQSDQAFYFYHNGKIDGFVKLKHESHLETGYCSQDLLKLCSLKLGFSCKIFANQVIEDISIYAKQQGYKTIYATCQERHMNVIKKLQKHGYEIFDEINHEFILLKRL